MSDPLQIALWSAAGAGPHYYGPGTNAWRMYSHLDPDDGRVTLLHASAEQRPVEGFASMRRVSRSTLPRAGRELHAAFAAANHLRRAQPRFDLVHVLAAYWQGIVVALAAERMDVPAVVKVTSEGTETALSGNGVRDLPRRLRFRLLSRVSAFVAITDTIADQLGHCGVPDGRIWRIPNGVDTELFIPASSPRDSGSRPLRILFAGSVVRRKRPHLAVQALARLRREVDAELWFAGPVADRRYFGELMAAAHSWGVDGHLRWLGLVDDMASLYRQVDVLCLPSAGEGMANVVLEAMASGVPFVVTPASGMAELSATGGGLLVEPDGESISDALADVLSAPRSFGAAGRTAAVERYSSASVLAEHMTRFRRLVGQSTDNATVIG